MQCPSCQFENMPGSSHCARCAASLSLATAEIDVNPPRASALQRRLPTRPMAAGRRVSNSVRAALAGVFGVTRPTTHFQGSLREYLMLAVPGLHQILHGEKPRGFLFLGIYGFLLVVTLLQAGSGPGSLMMGILFAWHVVATVDAIARDFVTSGDRFRLTAICSVAVFCLIYLPTMWTISQVATPLNIGMATRHFRVGDVVWYNSSATPQIGDMVLYEVETTTAQGRTRYAPVNYRIGGQRINRLVAMAGQTVRVREDGILLVDGQESPWQPTGHSYLPTERDIPVRPGHCFILPEDLLPGIDYQLSQNLSVGLAIVPIGNVQGSLVARTYPLSRMTLY